MGLTISCIGKIEQIYLKFLTKQVVVQIVAKLCFVKRNSSRPRKLWHSKLLMLKEAQIELHLLYSNFSIKVQHMAANYNILYGTINVRMVEQALEESLDTFSSIRAADSSLPDPIINRDLIGIVVALPPTGDEILTVAQIGSMTQPQPFETFLLKAASRAYEQRSRGNPTDIEPMERLAWLSKNALHKGASASANGVHVGFAGGWAHHGRLLAVSFVKSLSESMSLPKVEASKIKLFNDSHALSRLCWLNQGQDSGDNSPEAAEAHEKYRYIFDVLKPKF